MKRRFFVIPALIAALACLVPGSASAVWGGKLDTAHPQVGAMYVDFMDTDQPIIDGLVCSGSYAGASKDGQHDVFLTAGHCMPPPELGIAPRDLFVSFDNNASSNNTSDPVSNPIQVQAYHQMPGFGRDKGDLRDLGVLLCRRTRSPAPLRPCGFRRPGTSIR